ncbi:MAG: DUF456 family protein [Planctomycetota bacterium]|nr:MAG: DUF456 family protein [Planctomycetota bacterium]
MTALAAGIMALVGVAGVLATLFALPGLWLIVAAGAAVDLWRPDTYALSTLLIAAGLAVLAEVLELVAAGAGAKQAGGGKRAAVGAIAGAIVGAILGTPILPIVGTILGGAVGAGVGAVLLEGTKPGRSWADLGRVGRGAATGRLLATLIKAGFAVAVAVLLTVAAVV